MTDPACKVSFTIAYLKCQFEILLKAGKSLISGGQDDHCKNEKSGSGCFFLPAMAAVIPYILHGLEIFLYNSMVKYCIVSGNGLKACKRQPGPQSQP